MPSVIDVSDPEKRKSERKVVEVTKLVSGEIDRWLKSHAQTLPKIITVAFDDVKERTDWMAQARQHLKNRGDGYRLAAVKGTPAEQTTVALRLSKPEQKPTPPLAG